MPFVLGLLVGIGSLVLGIALHKRFVALKKACSAQTSGTVVRNRMEDVEETNTDSDSDTEEVTVTTMYYPVFEYTVGGVLYTKEGKVGSNRPKYQVGGRVNIFYDPTQPDTSYVAEEKGGNNIGMILIVAGPIIILLGLFFAFFAEY